jgi:hypothetical protein
VAAVDFRTTYAPVSHRVIPLPMHRRSGGNSSSTPGRKDGTGRGDPAIPTSQRSLVRPRVCDSPSHTSAGTSDNRRPPALHRSPGVVTRATPAIGLRDGIVRWVPARPVLWWGAVVQLIPGDRPPLSPHSTRCGRTATGPYSRLLRGRTSRPPHWYWRCMTETLGRVGGRRRGSSTGDLVRS